MVCTQQTISQHAIKLAFCLTVTVPATAVFAICFPSIIFSTKLNAINQKNHENIVVFFFFLAFFDSKKMQKVIECSIENTFF